MSNTRLESKIAKRKIMNKSIRLGIRDSWYYGLISPEKGIEIIACAEIINNNLEKIFGDKPLFLKVGKQSIYLMFQEPSTPGQLPVAVYAGTNLYGNIAIVAMLDEIELQLCEPLPLQSILTTLDLIWFSQDTHKAISIVFSNHIM